MSKLYILMKCFCSDGVGLWLWLAQVEWAMLSDIYIANKTNYLSNIVNLQQRDVTAKNQMHKASSYHQLLVWF